MSYFITEEKIAGPYYLNQNRLFTNIVNKHCKQILLTNIVNKHCLKSQISKLANKMVKHINDYGILRIGMH